MNIIRSGVLVAATLVICCFVAFAQDIKSLFTGQDWKDFTEHERSFFVAGFAYGYKAGYDDSSKKISPLEYYKFSYGQIRDTMDIFYGDYRNAPVCWTHALYISVESLKGSPAPEAVVNGLRANDAKNGCLGKQGDSSQ